MLRLGNNYDSKVSSNKSQKTLKIKRRVSRFSNVLLEEVNENEENYFKSLSPDLMRFPSFEENKDICPREIVGPASIFNSNKSKEPQILNKRQMFRLSTRRITNTQVNYKLRFEEILQKIEEAKNKSQKEEKMKIKFLSPREKIVANREKKILQHFDKTEKNWKGLEKNLAGISKKPLNQLIFSQSLDSRKFSQSPFLTPKVSSNHLQDNFQWLMSLRDEKESKNLETYIRIGSDLTGIYARIKCKDSDITQETDFLKLSDENINELQIIGNSKLPLEIEAVKKIGYEYLRPELLNSEKIEEVICEDYDKKVKSTNI